MRICEGKTVNGIDVWNAISESTDYTSELCNGYFARFSSAKDEKGDGLVPAVVAFSYKHPFVPLYAKVLDYDFCDYRDAMGFVTDAFEVEVSLFSQDFSKALETFSEDINSLLQEEEEEHEQDV